MKFNKYLNEIDALSAVEIAYFIDQYDELNENVMADMVKGFKSLLPKLGLTSHKGKGLIQILAQSTKGAALMLYYAFKVSMGEDQYKEKIKQLITSISREDLMDILMRLDLLTLHAITGPIHIIDALTGWHIGVDTMARAREVDIKAKKALQHLTDLSVTTIGETKKKLTTFIKQIKNVFRYSSQISTKVIQ